MNDVTKTAQNIDGNNHFFDLQMLTELNKEELNAVAGGANCSYLGVQDWGSMTSYCSRNYSC